MTKQETCENRIYERLEGRLEDLRKLWAFHCEGNEGYEPETESNLYEYGLCFDYVEPNTFKNQPYGYWRYQLSWGGPSDEFRLQGGREITYHFMDWYDGAKRYVEGNDWTLLHDIFDWFLECQEDRHGF